MRNCCALIRQDDWHHIDYSEDVLRMVANEPQTAYDQSSNHKKSKNCLYQNFAKRPKEKERSVGNVFESAYLDKPSLDVLITGTGNENTASTIWISQQTSVLSLTNNEEA